MMNSHSRQFLNSTFVFGLFYFKVEDGGVELHGLYAFTITGIGGRSFVVAASSPEEKTKWMDVRKYFITV